jgi:hypothetical protein
VPIPSDGRASWRRQSKRPRRLAVGALPLCDVAALYEASYQVTLLRTDTCRSEHRGRSRPTHLLLGQGPEWLSMPAQPARQAAAGAHCPGSSASFCQLSDQQDVRFAVVGPNQLGRLGSHCLSITAQAQALVCDQSHFLKGAAAATPGSVEDLLQALYGGPEAGQDKDHRRQSQQHTSRQHTAQPLAA